MSQLLGEVRLFMDNRPPSQAWIACDGSTLPIADHQPLFSLLGWRFGGDGWITFGVPALRPARAAVTYAIAGDGAYPWVNQIMHVEQHIGEIRLFAGKHPPAGWLPCDGRLLPAAEYAELYAVIGTSWGGVDNEFAVPDLRDADAIAPPAPRADRLVYIIAAASNVAAR